MDKVACPTCKKLIKWDTANPFRPFCCERCKLIDFGAWANDSYAIPDQPASQEDIEEFIKDKDHEADD